MTATGNALLPSAISICLVTGLLISVIARRPPRALWPVLPLYLASVVLYLVGDAITIVSREMAAEQLGVSLLYSGSLPAACLCWLLAIRYAEAQEVPFPWAVGWWIRGPIAIAVVGWVVMITNPWHGYFVTPVIGDHNVHNWAWWALVPWNYALVNGALFLYAVLAWQSEDRVVRRNAWLMAGAILTTLVFNLVSYLPSIRVPFDLTVVGLGGACAIFLYGSYRTRLFSLLPAAVVDAARHDPSSLVLVDLEGGWLRSNPAASKLLGEDLKQPGRDVIALLARRLRDFNGGRLPREDLSRRLLQGPRSAGETFGPLLAGEGHWIEITATPIPQLEGRARVVSLRLSDVSARVAAEEQLWRARRELAMETAERRRVDILIGDILRDAELAVREIDSPRRAARLVARIRRSAEQARLRTGAVVSKR